MSSFHDQIFSEMDAARKMAADYVTRYGRTPAPTRRLPSAADRQAQEAAAEAEIAVLAEEEQLTREARERAEQRAKVRTAEKAAAGKDGDAHLTAEHTSPRWNAMEILDGLAKLRARERSAAEELIRKAHVASGDEASAGSEQAADEGEDAVEKPAASFRAMWSPAQGAAQVWYFTSAGTRYGPVTFAELRTMSGSQMLDPRNDMVWKEGMAGWKPAGLLDGLFERRPFPAGATETKAMGKKPKAMAALPKDLTAALASRHMVWPGVGRRSLWVGLLLVPLLWNQLPALSGPAVAALSGGALTFKMPPFAWVVPVAILIHLILMRLVNLGMSRWWAVVLAVPLLNLWVAFRCLVCPSGFAHHRKLDRSGIAILLAVLTIIPAVCYLEWKHPGMLAPGHLRTALPGLIESAAKKFLTE